MPSNVILINKLLFLFPSIVFIWQDGHVFAIFTYFMDHFLIFVIIFNPYFILMTSLSSDTSCMFSSYTLRFFVCISFVIALLCAPWRHFPLKWNYRIAFYSFPSLFFVGRYCNQFGLLILYIIVNQWCIIYLTYILFSLLHVLTNEWIKDVEATGDIVISIKNIKIYAAYLT